MANVSKLIFGAAIAAARSQIQRWLPIRASQFLLIRMDMSHEAAKDAAFTIASRRRRVRGCRLVIHVAVSVTQGVNREEVVDSAGLPFCPFSPNKGHQYPRLTTAAGSGGCR